MRIRILTLIVLIINSLLAFGQHREIINLTFTAIDSADHVQLDSIKIINRTVGDVSTIYWPDTSISIELYWGNLMLFIGYSSVYSIGIKEKQTAGVEFQMFNITPNPVTDHSMISLYMPEQGSVKFLVTDLMGRLMMISNYKLKKGLYTYKLSPGHEGLFFLTARWNRQSRTIKFLSVVQDDGNKFSLETTNYVEDEPQFKISDARESSVMESGILDIPLADSTYTFQFATNIPCPGTPTIEYEGQVYNTIQVFSQCWLKENLNTGIMIPGELEQSNNGTIEKYCYADNEAYCSIYGGLYRWNELMQYTTIQGVQGICPPGWHVPTEEELKVLEGAVDSQYGIGDPEWDMIDDWRGYDVCANLKTINYWPFGDGGTDLYGFSVLPAGSHFLTGFSEIGNSCFLWTSTDIGEAGPGAHGREFRANFSDLLSLIYYKEIGLSVRCLKDD